MKKCILHLILIVLAIGETRANAQYASPRPGAARSEAHNSWDVVRRRQDPVGFLNYTAQQTRRELDSFIRMHEAMQTDLHELTDELDRKREEQENLAKSLQTLKTHLLANSFPLTLDDQMIHSAEQAERLVSDQLNRSGALSNSIDAIRRQIEDADAERGILLKRIEEYRVQLLLIKIRRDRIQTTQRSEKAPVLHRQLQHFPVTVPVEVQSHNTEVLQFLNGEQ